jgi:hypothetical protein
MISIWTRFTEDELSQLVRRCNGAGLAVMSVCNHDLVVEPVLRKLFPGFLLKVSGSFRAILLRRMQNKERSATE